MNGYSKRQFIEQKLPNVSSGKKCRDALPAAAAARPQFVKPKGDVAGLHFEHAAIAVSHPVVLELVDLRLETCKAQFEQCYERIVAYCLGSKRRWAAHAQPRTVWGVGDVRAPQFRSRGTHREILT
jgi:hypothetical protein